MHAASLKTVQNCRFSLRYVARKKLCIRILLQLAKHGYAKRILETRDINIVASA